MLKLPREPLAHRGVAELRLTAREHGRPPVGREQAVQEQRQQLAPQREHFLRDELGVTVTTVNPEPLQPERERVNFLILATAHAERESAIRTVRGDGFDAPELYDGAFKIVAQLGLADDEGRRRISQAAVADQVCEQLDLAFAHPAGAEDFELARDGHFRADR
jgi:hypothetical protein